MPVRVLHIIQTLKGYGAERQVRDLLPHLQGDDLSVGVLTVYASQMSAEERAALPFPTIDIGRKNRLDYSFLPRLIGQIRRFAPDIVHTHTHSGKYWGRIAAKLAGVPIIVHTEHNPCNPLRSTVERLIDPLLHAFTTRIVTFLCDQRRVLSEMDRVPLQKISVIANGLQSMPDVSEPERRNARRALCPDDDRTIIVNVGRLTYQKNQQLALRAFALLPDEQRRGALLLFAGTGEDENALRQFAHDLEVASQVRFLGYRPDICEVLPGADLLLMTSLFEGMPLTLIEAMNAHLPILSTPWTGAAEMLGNGRYGFLSAGWSPEDVAQSLSIALASEPRRARVADLAASYVRQTYTLERVARAHRSLYFELAAAAPAAFAT